MFKPAMISALIATAPLAGCTAPASQPRPQPSAWPDFSSALGQSTRLGGRTITPLAVLEDSRCPANANCVQAGTVRVQLSIEEGTRKRTSEIGLGKPLAMDGDWLHLTGVCPHPIAPNPVPLAQYRFQFAVEGSAVPATVAADCF